MSKVRLLVVKRKHVVNIYGSARLLTLSLGSLLLAGPVLGDSVPERLLALHPIGQSAPQRHYPIPVPPVPPGGHIWILWRVGIFPSVDPSQGLTQIWMPEQSFPLYEICAAAEQSAQRTAPNPTPGSGAEGKWNVRFICMPDTFVPPSPGPSQGQPPR